MAAAAFNTFAQPCTVRGARAEIVLEGGKILSVKDTASGEEFLSNSATPIFTLRFSDGGKDVSSSDAKIACEQKDGEVIVRAEAVGGLDISAVCTFRADKTNGQIRAGVSLENNSERAIEILMFPTLRLKVSQGENPQEDTLVFPSADGCIIRNPSEASTIAAPYPGNLSMQMFARYSKKAGLYVSALDSECHSKSFYFTSNEKSFNTTVLNKLPLVLPLKWNAYEFAIDTFKGDWQTAADIYREWTTKQKWCEKTFKQRVESGDIAKWIADPSLYCVYVIGGRSDTTETPLRADTIAQYAEDWAKAIGCPTSMIIWGWEKNGIWITPDYFPPLGGTENFVDQIKKLHAQSNRIVLYLSGLNWTVKNAATANSGVYDRSEEFANSGVSKGAIVEKDGKLTRTGHPHMGEYATMCPGTPQADKVFFKPLKKLVSYGADCVQADQMVGGGVPDCYSKDHKHPPFGGKWKANAVYDLFKKCRDFGKSKNPDFALSVEEPGEYFIQVLDTYHARDYKQQSWPRNFKNAEGVPLFTYVYHDYINGYGGDSARITENAKPHNSAYYDVAMNLVCGKAPAISVGRNNINPAKANAVIVKILREHVRLMREHSEFLVYGRQVATSAPDVPAFSASIWEKGVKKTFNLPSVVYARWESPDKKRADVYVCIADKAKFARAGKEITMKAGDVLLLKAD